MTLSPGDYRAVSVWQPWAWAIFNGKGIENRIWNTNYRGQMLIHASKTKAGIEDLVWLLKECHGLIVPKDLAFGAIIGTADLYDCVYSDAKSECGWGMPQHWHWKLRNQTLLTEPIPYRGLQRIFKIKL